MSITSITSPFYLYDQAMNCSNTQQQVEQEEEEEEEKEEDKARCEWDFNLSAVLSPPSSTSGRATDVIGAIEIDPTDRLLATGGNARKIRIHTLHPLRCDFYLCTPAKISSLRWRPNSAGAVIAAGDYDGVVTEYDVERRLSVSERDEHGGRRVWSVDYSKTGDLTASGSDEGSAHVWDPQGGVLVSAIRIGSPVCSVEFDKEEGVYLGLGCADRCAYVYDMRNLSTGPVSKFLGHQRTVAYVRFDGRGRLVTSGTDGCHRLWEVSSGREVRVYRGHANARSFVGMSVLASGGLIGCGSETNEVFVYDMRWGEPIWIRSFGSSDGDGNGNGDREGFVSAVGWRELSEDECTLVAGGSDGVLQLFAGKRKV